MSWSLVSISLLLALQTSDGGSSDVVSSSEIGLFPSVTNLKPKVNRPMKTMILWGLESRPELNGMKVVRSRDKEVFIQTATKSFRIPVHEFEQNKSVTNQKTFSVKLSSIYTVTHDLLAECAQILMGHMHQMNVFSMITEPALWTESESYHLLSSLAEKAGDEMEDIMMVILDTLSQGNAVRKRALERAFDGIAAYESVWAMANAEEYQSGDSKALAKRILHGMTEVEVHKRQRFVHRLGRIAHDNAGGGQKGFDCLVEIAESLSENNNKMSHVVGLFDEIGDFLGIVD